MTTHQIDIPADLLAAVALAQAKGGIRYYLNGVCAQPDGRLIATDGHRMHVGKMPTNSDIFNPLPCECIIPSDTLKVVAGIKGRTHHSLVATLSASAQADSRVSRTDKSSYDWTLAGVPFKPEDGRFPDWRKVIPSAGHVTMAPADGSPIVYNPEYLADVKKAQHLLGVSKRNKDGQALGVPHHVQDRIGLFAYEGTHDRFIAVVMPYRSSWVPLDAWWLK